MDVVATQQLAAKYQKKTDKQHVLDNPDTYTGSMEITDNFNTFVCTAENDKIIAKEIQMIPGLYKLFDEGIVNCRDHVVRMQQQQQQQPLTTCTVDASADASTGAAAATAATVADIPVTEIDVGISADGIITMTNNGNGIDVAKHPEENIWIPELIFAHLRTSTNYDKEEKKKRGGKNGFGIKLVFIWSSWGKIETVDHVRGLKYTQEFADNLSVIHPPKITKYTKKPYTTISFKPDYKRLGLEPSGGLTADMLHLFQRRVYDIAAVTDKSVKVKFNGVLVPVKSFQQYVDLFVGDKSTVPRVYEQANEDWEYAVCLAPKEEFQQVSFVNGIYTANGGRHVEYIMAQILRKLAAYIKLKKKIDVKVGTIKEQIMLFLRCDIDNPTFDSQTKEYMSTSSSVFGSACDVSDKFIEKLAKMGIMDQACALTEVKDIKAAKKSDGTKTKSVRGIPKLTDANDAGGPNSFKCSLILCEGDSAKSGIISGLTATDRNTIGVYPLRGKLFNVRGETAKRVAEVKEVNEIKQAMGLQTGKKYSEEDRKRCLRYGRVILMTDQDLDGSHIKGLVINLFDSEWRELLELDDFLCFMNTPIIKALKGAQEKVFYNDGEYNVWKDINSLGTGTGTGTGTSGWNIKYYKGLGTSTPKEFKEYFAKKKIVSFASTGEVSRDAIDMAFNKKRAKDRQDWLTHYDRTLYLDTNQPRVPYEQFIKEELVHFSQKDCERSIPNVMDGLKTSHRKILYTCFKRKLTSSVKVAQLAGSVSEISCYHHGDASLHGAIVNMAQNYVGSNNINLLYPDGQFGTRLQGGEDAASPRYINTRLSTLTRQLFPEADDHVLTSLEDDGTMVEPIHYVPIIPMLLINGSKGIGTGFSTDIMAYNPLEIIDYMLYVLSLPDDVIASKIHFTPYYEGFKGSIQPTESAYDALVYVADKFVPDKFVIKGKYEILNDKQVRITELPIGMWNDAYLQFLEDLIEQDTSSASKRAKVVAEGGETATKKAVAPPPLLTVKDYKDNSTDVNVDITITCASGQLKELEMQDSPDKLGNLLEKVLKLYTTKTTSNMNAFDENEKLVKFTTVQDIITHFMRVRLVYYTKRKAYMVAALQKELQVLSNKARFITEILQGGLDMRHKSSAEVCSFLQAAGYDPIHEDTTYKYLVNMPMYSVTEEQVLKLMTEREKKKNEVFDLLHISEQQLWQNELQALRAAYVKEQQQAVLPVIAEAKKELKSADGKKRKLKSVVVV